MRDKVYSQLSLFAWIFIDYLVLIGKSTRLLANRRLSRPGHISRCVVNLFRNVSLVFGLDLAQVQSNPKLIGFLNFEFTSPIQIRACYFGSNPKFQIILLFLIFPLSFRGNNGLYTFICILKVALASSNRESLTHKP